MVDDAGATVRLDAPAQRIIALSPHAAELIFSAGADSRLVGSVAYSDFPAAAEKTPRIGNAARLDREAILSLRPDLAIAWPSGNQEKDLEWLEKRGISIYQSEPRQLRQISEAIREIGQLAGTADTAARAASSFDARLQGLKDQYRTRPPLTAFYQIWPQPLFTIGKTHLINEALAVCNIQNIFSGLSALAPMVSREAVILANPQLIIAASAMQNAEDAFADWRRWSAMQAVANKHLIEVLADLIHRPTPRILDGIETICRQLPIAEH